MSFKRSDLRALADLTWRERLRLLGAVPALVVSLALLKALGYRRTLRAGERLSRSRPLPDDAVERARSTARLVLVADDRLPLPGTCLSRALALWYLLRLQGVPVEIRLGVRAGAVPLDAHAWVVYGEEVLADDEANTSTYAVLQRPPRDA